jgi:hypothetical protein
MRTPTTGSGHRTTGRIQRAKIVLDVAIVDFEVSEETLGPVHPTTQHFRETLDAARTSWDRLRAEFGGKTLERELGRSAIAVVRLDPQTPESRRRHLILIQGKTYAVESVPGTPVAPILFRIQRLNPRLEFGPYYLSQLADGSMHCDCAEWAYRDDSPGEIPCKHLSSLSHLGWIYRA